MFININFKSHQLKQIFHQLFSASISQKRTTAADQEEVNVRPGVDHLTGFWEANIVYRVGLLVRYRRNGFGATSVSGWILGRLRVELRLHQALFYYRTSFLLLCHFKERHDGIVWRTVRRPAHDTFALRRLQGWIRRQTWNRSLKLGKPGVLLNLKMFRPSIWFTMWLLKYVVQNLLFSNPIPDILSCLFSAHNYFICFRT